MIGVFDGHGMLGAEAAQFVCTELPKFLAKDKELPKNRAKCIKKQFVACNTRLVQRYGIVWYGIVWYGIVWYGMV